MADYNTTNDDLDTTNDTEPATKHDVGIGGGLGVVGGAIVGGLAGGPVGAIIGAVVGGAASAGAVDVVDKHDHDYARTVGTDTTAAPAYAASDDYATDTVAPAAATGYTGAGDYQRTTATPVATDTAYDTIPAAAATDIAYDTARVGTDTDRSVQLHDEVLSARKDQVQTGEVTLRKEVITETKSIDVPVTREEVVIERHAVSGGAASSTDFSSGEEVIRVPVMEEQVTLEKTPVVTGEVSLGKRQVTETQHLSGTVRHEEARIENPDNVDVIDRS